ncbi:MAG: sulfatase/phosphatase domain-containing protein, partial [Planctomycetota bacterium]
APHGKDFFQSTAGLRGYKGRVYEGGIRTPFLVRWPRVVEPGAVSDHVSAFWDLWPTIAELAGGQPPKDIDGISFLPTLKGKPQPRHEYLYWEFPARGYQQAIRKGKWKAVRPRADRPIELYDLQSDPREARDVARQHPELVAEFAELFKSARTDSDHWPFPGQDK